MIDTTKYDGHSEGKWEVFGDGCDSFLVAVTDVVDGGRTRKEQKWIIGDDCGNPSDADCCLIEDAPLLLAEVKRLRAELDKLTKGNQ